VLVRDGFSAVALVFGGFWFAWHRMWLVLTGYIVVALMLTGAAVLTGLDPPGGILLQSLFSFSVGLEASRLRRWHVERAGFGEVAVVHGRDQDEAEMRYFAQTI